MDAAVKQLQSDFKTLSAGANTVDPITELGIHLEEKRYESRFNALTNPKKYKADRDTAFGDLKNAVAASYQTAFNAFLSAGHPVEAAKQMSLAAAEGERRVQAAILESRFPAAANDIGLSAASAQSGAFAGHISGATSRAAPHPAVRRKRAKKRAPTRKR